MNAWRSRLRSLLSPPAIEDPEGRRLVYISDASGEEAIHIRDAWGRGEEEVAKRAGQDGWHFAPRFSPDGEWVAFGDQSQTLYDAAPHPKRLVVIGGADHNDEALSFGPALMRAVSELLRTDS